MPSPRERLVLLCFFLSWSGSFGWVEFPLPRVSRWKRSRFASWWPANDERRHPPLLAVASNPDPVAASNDTLDYPGRLSNDNPDYRCGFVAIMGLPNMGKSTLLNALLEQPLCIATPRPQTTRHAILGLLSTESTQVCFLDTPGILRQDAAYELQETMMQAVVKATCQDANVLLIVTDVHSNPPEVNDEDDEAKSGDVLFAQLIKKSSNKPIVICINKIDQASDDKQLERTVGAWRACVPQATAIIPTSAVKGPSDPGVIALSRLLTGGPEVAAAVRNLGRPIPGMLVADKMVSLSDEDFRNEILSLPQSPPLYELDVLTDRPERFIASELIRSTLLELLHKELPYCCQVEIVKFKEPSNNSKMIRIEANIIVERDSQKIIVIGKRGRQIKQIGIEARKKLQDFFQHKIFLTLNVKVDRDWRKNKDKLKQFGYLP